MQAHLAGLFQWKSHYLFINTIVLYWGNLDYEFELELENNVFRELDNHCAQRQFSRTPVGGSHTLMHSTVSLTRPNTHTNTTIWIIKNISFLISTFNNSEYNLRKMYEFYDITSRALLHTLSGFKPTNPRK